MEFNRAKNRAARDRAWQERLDRDPRSDAYQYKVRMEDMANQREIALQQTRNKGLVDVANRNQLGATNRERMSQMGQTGRTGLEQAGMTGRLGNQQDFTTEQNRRKYLQDRINFYSTPEYSKDGMQLLRGGLDPELSREAALRDMQLSYGGQRENALSTYTPELGKPLPGNYPQTPLSERPVNTTRQPLGQATIESNLGNVLGLDKAQNISNAFNYGLRGVWQGSTDLGQAMINRGIKPAYNWATQKYTGY